MTKKPRTLITDAQWRRIQPRIRGKRTDRGVTGRYNRRFVEGVFWILRTGAPWRDLPYYFGRWNTLYQRFRRWSLTGVWEHIWRALVRKNRGRTFLLDSTVIRAHQHACCWRGSERTRHIGRSRGGVSTKLHVIVTPDWHLLAHRIGRGEGADITQAPQLARVLKQGSTLLADRAYDSDRFIAQLAARHVAAEIPPRKNRLRPRAWSRTAYATRHHIENYFARLKHFRRLATRFEKRVPMFRGFFLAANVAIEAGLVVR
jgi:transposase